MILGSIRVNMTLKCRAMVDCSLSQKTPPAGCLFFCDAQLTVVTKVRSGCVMYLRECQSRIFGIQMAWRSHQVQFLAQGEAPFTLRFGSAKVNSWPSVKWYQTLTQPMKHSLFSSAVWLGEISQLIHAPVEQPEEQQPTDSSRLVFWGLLALVLTFLLVMAVRLLREVGGES